MFPTKSLLLLLRQNNFINCCRITYCCNQNTVLSKRTIDRTNKTSNELSKLIIIRHYNYKESDNVDKKPALKLKFVDDNPKLTHKTRLKRLIAEYGPTAVIIHIVLSLISLGAWYAILSMGIDAHNFMDFDSLKVGETTTKVIAGSGTFVIAYAIHKATMPARIAATLLITPRTVKFLRTKGILKPK